MKLNGYMTIACYLTIAVLSIAKAPHASTIALWFLGLSLHGLQGAYRKGSGSR